MSQDNSIDTVEVKKEYYDSGALYSETPYVNGEKQGIEKHYYESGALELEIPYVNGKRHGIEKRYNKDKANIEYLVLYKENWKVASIKSNIQGD